MTLKTRVARLEARMGSLPPTPSPADESLPSWSDFWGSGEGQHLLHQALLHAAILLDRRDRPAIGDLVRGAGFSTTDGRPITDEQVNAYVDRLLALLALDESEQARFLGQKPVDDYWKIPYEEVTLSGGGLLHYNPKRDGKSRREKKRKRENGSG